MKLIKEDLIKRRQIKGGKNIPIRKLTSAGYIQTKWINPFKQIKNDFNLKNLGLNIEFKTSQITEEAETIINIGNLYKKHPEYIEDKKNISDGINEKTYKIKMKLPTGEKIVFVKKEYNDLSDKYLPALNNREILMRFITIILKEEVLKGKDIKNIEDLKKEAKRNLQNIKRKINQFIQLIQKIPHLERALNEIFYYSATKKIFPDVFVPPSTILETDNKKTTFIQQFIQEDEELARYMKEYFFLTDEYIRKNGIFRIKMGIISLLKKSIKNPFEINEDVLRKINYKLIELLNNLSEILEFLDVFTNYILDKNLDKIVAIDLIFSHPDRHEKNYIYTKDKIIPIDNQLSNSFFQPFFHNPLTLFTNIGTELYQLFFIIENLISRIRNEFKDNEEFKRLYKIKELIKASGRTFIMLKYEPPYMNVYNSVKKALSKKKELIKEYKQILKIIKEKKLYGENTNKIVKIKEKIFENKLEILETLVNLGKQNFLDFLYNKILKINDSIISFTTSDSSISEIEHFNLYFLTPMNIIFYLALIKTLKEI
ncbi:MAG: hypothetical protein ABIL45_03820 [candidate division WOR-3 bacterium]